MKEKVNLEQLILQNLLTNEEFGSKALPYLQRDYFTSLEYQIGFDLISSYVSKYLRYPTKEALQVELNDVPKLTDQSYKRTSEWIDSLEEKTKGDTDWILDKTEKFITKQAIRNALKESIAIVNGQSKQTEHAIPDILKQALGAGFNQDMGHEYFADAEKQFEFYHSDIERLPFGLAAFNDATRGGIPNKTLNILMASTGVGKSKQELLSGLMQIYLMLKWRISMLLSRRFI